MIVTVVLDFDDAEIAEANSNFADVAQSIRARMEEVFIGTDPVVDTKPNVLDVFETSLPIHPDSP